MGAEQITVVFVSTLAAVAVAAFGLFRHRANQLVWTSAGGGAVAGPSDAGTQQDPLIARRIAALLEEDDPPTGLSVDCSPVELADGDAGPGTLLAEPEVAPMREAIHEYGTVAEGATGTPPPDAVEEPGEPLVKAGRVPFDPEETLRRLLVDPVTGLGSSLAWDRWVADEEARERRYRRPTTLVVAEITGLDTVAAFFGSDAAIRIVADVADIVRANVRASDRAALVGPARFAVLLPETDEIRAVNFVERLRAACDRWLAANAPTVGIGFGWASPTAKADLATARDVADRRLAVDLWDAPTGPSRA